MARVMSGTTSRHALLPLSGRAYRNPKKNGQLSNIAVMALCIASFMAGSLWTTLVSMASSRQIEVIVPHPLLEERHVMKEKAPLKVNDKVTASLEEILKQRKLNTKDDTAGSSKDCSNQGFPASVKKYAVGMARVNRDNFTQTFDMGVPIDKTAAGTEDVLLLYKGSNALPNVHKNEATGGVLPIMSSEEATANCDSMHVILTEPTDSKKKQCIAIVPQFPSFHIQNWMRVDAEKEGAVDSEHPLRIMGRGYQNNGVQNFGVPFQRFTRQHWNMLQTYFSSLDDVLKELKAMTKPIAHNNAVVVMVCNHGQSELLINFACSAKSRGISIQHVLVFATDPETKHLADELGMTAYYDERNFGHAPTEAAVKYGDKSFGAMMLAKVYCVQLVSMLGYDLLFQDVDTVWFRDPVPFFQNAAGPLKDFDIYFQEDGNHSIRYAPYSANSGFYWVRHNKKTRHFLTSLLMAGDSVLNQRSHQQVMISILAEHASLYGLRVKVFQRDTTDEFPGGHHFHNAHDWMKALFKGEKQPYIFHMSWTTNKDNKLNFLRQMGEWYVQDKCIGKTVDAIRGKSLDKECCSADPLISCHFRDKPSKIPCPESPNIDKNQRSFW